MAKVKVRMRKYMGDDIYSWAVFRSDQDRPVVTGLSQYQARYYRKKIEKRVEEENKGE